MTLWIPLTTTHIELLVNATQRESLAARPNQGFDNDPLTLAINDVTRRFRLAIRKNELNSINADESTLPPEMISTAAALCLGALDDTLPGFSLTPQQEVMLDLASDRLADIANGSLPVTKSTNAQTPSLLRRSIGLSVERSRAGVLSAGRLAGL